MEIIILEMILFVISRLKYMENYNSNNWLDRQKIWSVLSSQVENLVSSSFAHNKMYVMSIFSKLVYHHLSNVEIKFQQQGRATIVPSSDFQRLVTNHRQGDSSEFKTLLSNMDARIVGEIIESDHFITAVIEIAGIYVISIRGTSSSYDWLINLKAWKSNFNEDEYHTGFLKEAEHHLSELNKFKIDKQIPVYMTGHSMGGALAAIISEITQDSIGNIISVYTFGMPRYQKQHSKNNKPLYACIRNGDPVPHIPPLYINPKEMFSTSGEPIKSLHSILGTNLFELDLKGFAFNGFPDHQMERYCTDIHNAVKNKT